MIKCDVTQEEAVTFLLEWGAASSATQAYIALELAQEDDCYEYMHNGRFVGITANGAICQSPYTVFVWLTGAKGG